ncbi:ATP-binding protein [Microbacterium sp. 13-71-7]|uniref:ATP-binding protein n=1 Tax=Microbacterium sp. 13-71-7 TaxID=1970399 RepID=UPI000BC7AFC6|nr:ATP-binding protein [Microbacterium sp. 13-71-7]OZB85056.1 MAG: hypothetical protein B7X32_04880 [Microbacterium sp. 13-71-7]
MSKANTDIPKTPQWETYARKPLPNGIVPGIDNSMWMVRTVPMGAVVDAKSIEDALKVGAPIDAAFRELAGMAANRGISRRLALKSYRQFQILLTNFPRWFSAPPSSPIAGYLNAEFGHREVLDRRVLFAVPLRATTGNGKGAWDYIDSMVETLARGGSRVEDFERDAERVGSALARAGLEMPGAADYRAAEAWFNHGRHADIPQMEHPDHMHFFRSPAAAATAERMGVEDCEPWLDTADHMAVSFYTVSGFDLGYTDVQEPRARWVPHLVDSGARVISIRGVVEPDTVTRKELVTQRRHLRNDHDEALEQGKRDRGAQEEAINEVDSIEQAYATNKGSMPPTLVDTSIIVGFAGVHEDASKLSPPSIELHSMMNRQLDALHETMLCSNVRSSPSLHDLPSTTVAYSGLPNLTVVGDSDGMLVGFTSDQQAVYLSPVAASSGDAAPLVLGSSMTGGGKTLLAQWLAFQATMMGRPNIFIDPKEGSDLDPVVHMVNGRVVSFDDFTSSDGGIDPLTVYETPQMGIPLASSMLFRVNPWGDDRRRTYEADIANALRYGVEHGATVTGQALRIAADAGIVGEHIVADVFKVAHTFPMFRATFGMTPGSQGLKVFDGMTLFKRGNADLSLPPSTGAVDTLDMDMNMRLTVNLLRMLVRSSMSALRGRGGLLQVDEAWVVERAAPDELNESGRLARSMKVLPVFWTQTPSGPLKLGLRGYFSRGLIGHISDEEEAQAGLQLFKAENPTTMRRVTAPEYLSGGSGQNWDSLKALFETTENPVTGEVKRRNLRGSVFYYADLKQRFAPVQVDLPPRFLREASTSPDEVAARKQASLRMQKAV